MDFKNFLTQLYLVVSLIPIVYGCIRFKKLDWCFKFLVLILIYAFLSDKVIGIFRENLPIARTVYRLWRIVEIFFLLYFFHITVDHTIWKKISKYLLFTFLPFFIIINFIPLVTFASPGTDNTWIQMMFKLGVSFLYATQILRWTEKRSDLLQFPLFWVYSAMFYDQLSSFFVHLLIKLNLHVQVWFISNVNTILALSAITIGLWKAVNSGSNDASKETAT